MAYEFHNYKESGVTKTILNHWCKKVGWQLLLNKKSTTWRALSPEEQAKISNQDTAVDLMLRSNSIIKRPVIEVNEKLMVGLNEDELLKQSK